MKPQSQRGVALVITLIMLAVVTFMATAFLTLSRRERGAVKVTTDQTTAGLMADMAAEHAVAQTVGSIMAHSNMSYYDLLVSTNFINPAGFQSGLVHWTNVSYVRPNGSFITNNANDILVNLGNMKFLPRPPVYYAKYTNNNRFLSNEFRFYYDLNRNGLFEDTGSLMVLNNRGVALGYSNSFIGDPQWVGVLERTDLPHSPTNRFIGRYAFIALPAGKTLDLNFIHNQAKSTIRNASPSARNFGTFFRNQGVGSWEINLGAFFRDLNNNCWPIYLYSPSLTAPNQGLAFMDAYDLLRYRANELRNRTNTLLGMYGATLADNFERDGIDIYSDGPLMNSTAALPAQDGDNTQLYWPGSDNGTNFYDVQQLLAMPLLPNLGPRVNGTTNLNTRNSSYDRYTFYRLLAQLGVDSRPAWYGRMHLNYRSDAGYHPTNLVRWTPIAFFTNAADLMLRSQFNLSVTNISVYPNTNNYYSAPVHRLLQLAANLFDAATNSPLPSVFRPVFAKTETNVYITAYRYEPTSAFIRRPWRDLSLPADRNALQPDDNVYGVPVVIGAKKGYPNFNEGTMQTVIELTRKLELRKRLASGLPIATNQLYILGISNIFGIEGWNSYARNFTRPLELRLTNLVSMALVTSNTIIWPPNRLPFRRLFSIEPTQVNITSWDSNAFLVHMMTNTVFLTNSAYSSGGGFTPIIPVGFQYSADLLNVTNPVYLMITNRLQYILVDKTSQRVVDFVNLNDLVNQINLTRELVGSSFSQDNIERSLWSQDYGLTNQIQVSLGNEESRGIWNAYSQDPVSGDDKAKAIDRFRIFMGLAATEYPRAAYPEAKQALQAQTPFNPTRKFVITSSMQVNDPLVHYTFEDLLGGQYTNTVEVLKPPTRSIPPSNLGLLNLKYRPWGGNPGKDVSNDQTAYSTAYKDPQVRKSDDWQFPTNLYPNLGWMGRVHRGTPWQTVYLKSSVAQPQVWNRTWSARLENHPTNDWWLLDLFSTAPNENAARGLLSVNQTNLAAWSAVLSGVNVLTNESPTPLDLIVAPSSPQLQAIVADINSTRLSTPTQAFSRLGSILAVPALTDKSPFLGPTTANENDAVTTDAVLERIPQQILSLLKSDEPRIVVYALGQSLRPAPNSLVLQPGNYYRMCTNYEVAAETITKTVLRIEGNPVTPRVVRESYNILPAE